MEAINDREYDDWIYGAFSKPRRDAEFIIVPEGCNSFDVFMGMLSGEIGLVEDDES